MAKRGETGVIEIILGGEEIGKVWQNIIFQVVLKCFSLQHAQRFRFFALISLFYV